MTMLAFYDSKMRKPYFFLSSITDIFIVNLCVYRHSLLFSLVAESDSFVCISQHGLQGEVLFEMVVFSETFLKKFYCFWCELSKLFLTYTYSLFFDNTFHFLFILDEIEMAIDIFSGSDFGPVFVLL